jgi:hypothetical protein
MVRSIAVPISIKGVRSMKAARRSVSEFRYQYDAGDHECRSGPTTSAEVMDFHAEQEIRLASHGFSSEPRSALFMADPMPGGRPR